MHLGVFALQHNPPIPRSRRRGRARLPPAVVRKSGRIRKVNAGACFRRRDFPARKSKEFLAVFFYFVAVRELGLRRAWHIPILLPVGKELEYAGLGSISQFALGLLWTAACLPTYGGLGVRVGGSKLSKPRNSPQAAPWLGFAWVGVFVKTDRFPLVCVRFRKHIWLGGLDGGPALKAQPRPRPPPWGGFSLVSPQNRALCFRWRDLNRPPLPALFRKGNPRPGALGRGYSHPRAPSPWPRASAFLRRSESFPQESLPAAPGANFAVG